MELLEAISRAISTSKDLLYLLNSQKTLHAHILVDLLICRTPKDIFICIIEIICFLCALLEAFSCVILAYFIDLLNSGKHFHVQIRPIFFIFAELPDFC